MRFGKRGLCGDWFPNTQGGHSALNIIYTPGLASVRNGEKSRGFRDLGKDCPNSVCGRVDNELIWCSPKNWCIVFKI